MQHCDKRIDVLLHGIERYSSLPCEPTSAFLDTYRPLVRSTVTPLTQSQLQLWGQLSAAVAMIIHHCIKTKPLNVAPTGTGVSSGPTLAAVPLAQRKAVTATR